MKTIIIGVGQVATFDKMKGVSYTDDIDTTGLQINVTGELGEPTPGTNEDYILTYTVTDSDRTTTTVNRVITVTNQLPEITGLDDIVINEGEGSGFDFADGVTATDFTGALIKVQVSEDYDISVPGEYTITYKAIDKYGNESEVKAILKVVEKPNNNQKPDDSGNKPDNEGSNPGDGVNKPDNGGSNPGDGVNKPDNEGSNPGDGVNKPNNGGSNPGDGVNKPNNGGSNPGDSVNKPDNGGSNPGNNINSSSNGTNTGQNTGNVNSGDSKNENVISENNNSTTNSSKIPTTGAAVGSGIIVSIGSVIALIGAYLFKKNR